MECADVHTAGQQGPGEGRVANKLSQHKHTQTHMVDLSMTMNE